MKLKNLYNMFKIKMINTRAEGFRCSIHYNHEELLILGSEYTNKVTHGTSLIFDIIEYRLVNRYRIN